MDRAEPMIPSRSRMTVSLLVLSACGALVAACGGGGGDPVVKARAVAFTSTVNLRAGDVGGTDRLSSITRPEIGTLVAGFETDNGPPFSSCTTDPGASGEVLAVESPWFLRARRLRRARGGRIERAERPPAEAVRSIVYIMREPVLASRDVAALRNAPGCVERLSVSEASGRFLHGEPYKRQINASSLPFSLSGVVGYGVRERGTLAAASYHQKQRPPFYEDTFGFAVGPAEIVLHADGIGRPTPPAVEARLLSVLYDRAKAHAL
jgi:hypothetical protein